MRAEREAKLIRMNYQNYTDEELAARAKTDRAAADFLLNKYKNMVRARAKAYFLAGGDSDDLVQEGMIGLFRAIGDFDPRKEASFSSFAELCVRRQIYTAIKSAGRQKHIPLNNYVSLNKPIDGEKSDITLSDTIPGPVLLDPENLYIRNENLRDIEREIEEKLSDLEKRVLILHLQGMSYGEIAEIINKPAKSIDNALQRIKKKLDES